MSKYDVMILFNMIKPGDRVTRMLAGTIPMEMTVTEVTDDLIIVGEWTFDRATGWEIDHEMRWGPEYAITGSFLKPPNN